MKFASPVSVQSYGMQSSRAACWALHQYLFGARDFQANAFREFASRTGFRSALALTACEDGACAGPLGQCPHSHDSRLIGFLEGCRSSKAAAYPPELCKYLAFLFFSAMSGLHATVAAHTDESLDISHPAEAFALTIKGFPTAAQVMILFDLLPKTRPPAKAGLMPGAAFFAGALRGSYGMQPRPTTRQFPLAAQKIASSLGWPTVGIPLPPSSFCAMCIVRASGPQ